MTVTEILAREFIRLAREELSENGFNTNFSAQRQQIESWCEVYEEVPPRNRAEIVIRDALEEARDLLTSLFKDYVTT